ncbi:MAG TPA: hypothetical protein PKD54_08860 [Pirellulaceae bacterium]|nr:hypothetical protein [Pirellulaceae bacterium]
MKRAGLVDLNSTTTGETRMPLFTIIVPCIDQVSEFETTLASVLRHRPDDCQVVATHAGFYRDPYGLAATNEIQLARAAGTDFANLLTAALSVSRGQWIIWLYPGSQLCKVDWTAMVAPFSSIDVGAVAPVITSSDASVLLDGVAFDAFQGIGRPLSATDTRAHSSIHAWGPTILAGAFRHDALRCLDFTQFISGESYWDVECACALNLLGYRSIAVPEWRIQSTQVIPSLIRFRQPHGAIACRLARRYTDRVSHWRHLVGDVASTLRAPWRLAHAWQRLSSMRPLPADDEYRQQMERLKEMRQNVNSRLADGVSRDAHDSWDVPRRRAA